MYLLCCAVWGSTWLFIKIGLRDLPPLHFATLRMGLACLAMAPFAFRRRGRLPTASEVPWIALSGLLQIGVAYALIFLAAQRIASGLAALLFCSFPIWMGLFGHWLLPDEPLTTRAVAASVLGLLGVGVIQGPDAAAALHGAPGPLLAGGLLVLGSSVVSAIANVLNKRYFASVSPDRNVWIQTSVGTAFLAALALSFEKGAPLRWTESSVFALFYLAVCGTALAFAALFWLIPRVPVAVIGTIPLSDTVIAVLLGARVLGERLSFRVLAGGVLILGGVLLASISGRETALEKDRSTAGAGDTAGAR